MGNFIPKEIDEFGDCIQAGKKPEPVGDGALTGLVLRRANIDSARTVQQESIGV
jgi:hypothetical protein